MAGVAATVLALAIAHSAVGKAVVVVEPQNLPSRVMRVSVTRPVEFVNRSGRRLHLELSDTARQHRVVGPYGRTSVRFSEPRRYPYVLRFADGRNGHLHGVVETHEHREDPGVPTCRAGRAERICLEP